MTVVLALAAYLVIGIVAGVLYFRCLWWNARQFAVGGRVATTICLMLGRIALLGGLLTVACLHGAIPLVLMASGVLLGRFAVMRGVRTAAQ